MRPAVGRPYHRNAFAPTRNVAAMVAWRTTTRRALGTTTLLGALAMGAGCSAVDGTFGTAGTPTGTSPAPAAAQAPSTATRPHALAAVVIGDSLTVQARDVLQQRLPTAVIDAEVGRTMVRPGLTDDALSRIPDLRDLDAAWFVVELGTNDATFNGYPIDQLDDDIDSVLDAIGRDRCIAWVLPFATNPRSPIEQANTEAFRELASSKVQSLACNRVLDWGALAIAEPPVLASDGVHLSPLGTERLADLVVFGVG